MGSNISKISKNGYPSNNNRGVPKSNTPTPKSDCITDVRITTARIDIIGTLSFYFYQKTIY